MRIRLKFKDKTNRISQFFSSSFSHKDALENDDGSNSREQVVDAWYNLPNFISI